jgi:RimJ/RimL family protein N-acetyltransferase
METILETERLILRPFLLKDVPFIIDLLNTKGWIEFIGDRNVKTIEQAEHYLKNGPMKSYVEHGYGLSLVELKNNHVPIGMCGIINRTDLEQPDIGFAFLPEYNGQGYAFEIATATLQFAKNKLKLSVIYGITASNNKASIKLLEKIGLRYIKNIKLEGDEEELLLYSN